MTTMRRHSKKRDAILECIRNSRIHPSAEWIYAQLKPQHPDLSLGTVYRNLSLFRQSGEIVCVATVHGVERLDADTHPHAHFICEKCGAVMDIELPVDLLREELRERYGCDVRRSDLLFHGICQSCGKEAKEDVEAEYTLASVYNMHS